VTKIPLIVNSFSDGQVLFIKSKINNKNANLLLDTGASRSILDLRKLDRFTSAKPLKSFNISGVQDNLDAYEMKIDKFSIGDKVIEGRIFYAVDLINLNNTFSSNYIDVVDGILGNDILFELVSKIDIEKKTIHLK
jgi:hypothetical protein